MAAQAAPVTCGSVKSSMGLCPPGGGYKQKKTPYIISRVNNSPLFTLDNIYVTFVAKYFNI